jgi:hypothetical protein
LSAEDKKHSKRIIAGIEKKPIKLNQEPNPHIPTQKKHKIDTV